MSITFLQSYCTMGIS